MKEMFGSESQRVQNAEGYKCSSERAEGLNSTCIQEVTLGAFLSNRGAILEDSSRKSIIRDLSSRSLSSCPPSSFGLQRARIREGRMEFKTGRWWQPQVSS